MIETIRNIPAALAMLPWLLGIIRQVKKRLKSEQATAFFGALRDFVASFFDDAEESPSPPIAGGGGGTSVDPTRREQRQQRRRERTGIQILNNFRNRLRLCTMLPESEVQELCQTHHIPYEEIT